MFFLFKQKTAYEMRISDWSSDVCSSDLKSSLAFGTIYAEAQRRYFESVAPYARRLIDQAGVPDVDAIDGLPPAVALQQQRGSSNARSSVGSVTTLSSLVRMMYSRAGAYPANQPMLYAEDFSPNTPQGARSEEHTSELQSLMRISHAVFCLKK